MWVHFSVRLSIIIGMYQFVKGSIYTSKSAESPDLPVHHTQKSLSWSPDTVWLPGHTWESRLARHSYAQTAHNPHYQHVCS